MEEALVLAFEREVACKRGGVRSERCGEETGELSASAAIPGDWRLRRLVQTLWFATAFVH